MAQLSKVLLSLLQLWILSPVGVSPGQVWRVPSVVPGTGCGGETPFRVVKSLGPILGGAGCSLVKDGDSFKKHYEDKVPGKFMPPKSPI